MQLTDGMNQIQVFTADEEKYLMEKVAGLLAESNARKKNMVHLFDSTLLSFLFFKTLIHPQTAFTSVSGRCQIMYKCCGTNAYVHIVMTKQSLFQEDKSRTR